MSGSLLTLTTAQRDLGVPGGATTELRKDGLTKSPVTYLDFTVDSARLFDRLNTLSLGTLDYVGVIQDAWPVESAAALKRLLGERAGDLPDGRVSLYVCPECGDLGCGAVTAKVSIDPVAVTWHNIAIQADYDNAIHHLSEDTLIDIIFDRTTYEGTLRRELARIQPLAQKFVYPYQQERRERRQHLASWLKGLISRH